MKGSGQTEAGKGKVCASCKRALPSGAKFCGFDGTRVDDHAENKANGAAGKQCSKCGKLYPAYAQFCPADASKLVEVRAEAAQSEPKPSPFAAPPGFAQPQAPKPPTEPVASPQASFQSSVQDLTDTAPPIDEELARSGDFGRNQAEPRKPTQMAETFDDENTGLFHNLIGKKIEGKYEVQSILGEGGMAIVYKAYHTKMERLVVIKVMQGWLLSNKNAVERFERESKTTAKLAHPNIVTVFDYGVLNAKEPYLVMEYIKGESLGDKIARQGALPFATAAGIIIQICRGLQEAHSVGIIHRDLKPDNILLQDRSDRPDWVKIVDFGISHLVQGAKRLTKTGKMVGTPEYIAPEQLKDKPLDIRTDLYALGIILYETLTGRVPFEGESAEGILMKHLLEPPPPLSLHNDDFAEGTPFDAIIAKALRKEPDERYQTATEFRLDVEEALNKVLLKRNSK
jgi:tRNA A-37 threonylcarbamoyl transferase component Bud32/RNA polymerase subunit RPABC4/transcription elongation factor Spt4